MKTLYFSTNNSAGVAVPFRGGTVDAISVTAGGSNYTSAPSVTIGTSNNGVTATAIATIANGAVSSISITSEGTGYTAAPTVTFSGGGGTGATATATVSTADTVIKVLKKLVIGNPIASGNIYVYHNANAIGGSALNLAVRITLPATLRAGEVIYDFTPNFGTDVEASGIELREGGSVVLDGAMQVTFLWDFMMEE